MHLSLVWLRLVVIGLVLDIDEDAGKVILSMTNLPLLKFALRMIVRFSNYVNYRVSAKR